MNDILKMIFMCFVISILLLLTVDLLGSETYYNESEHKKHLYKDFNEQLEYIFAINPKVSVEDAILIIEAIDDSYFRTGLTKLDFLLICGWESRFKKNTIGRIDKNDKGICQINRNTWVHFKEKEYINGDWTMIFDIDYNIYVSSIILMKYRERLLKIYPNKNSKEINKILIESYNKGVGGTKTIVKNEGKFDYYKNVMKMKEL